MLCACPAPGVRRSRESVTAPSSDRGAGSEGHVQGSAASLGPCAQLPDTAGRLGMRRSRLYVYPFLYAYIQFFRYTAPTDLRSKPHICPNSSLLPKTAWGGGVRAQDGENQGEGGWWGCHWEISRWGSAGEGGCPRRCCPVGGRGNPSSPRLAPVRRQSAADLWRVVRPPGSVAGRR